MVTVASSSHDENLRQGVGTKRVLWARLCQSIADVSETYRSHVLQYTLSALRNLSNFVEIGK